ncbi:MAG: hypothetical protein WCP35_02980 [Verrucomicrobiota bacterium]
MHPLPVTAPPARSSTELGHLPGSRVVAYDISMLVAAILTFTPITRC